MFLYGAGGHGKVVAEILLENGIEIEGVYSDNTVALFFQKFPFLGVFKEAQEQQEFIISIGNNFARKNIVESLHVKWGKAISKAANIAASASIGDGTMIIKGVSVNADASIGKHVILNTNCSVDHDCLIENFVHISPNVALAGNVTVGEGTHIGIGSCIIPGIKIGKWAVIGAGTVVVRDIPDYAVVVGNPGKVIKYNK